MLTTRICQISNFAMFFFHWHKIIICFSFKNQICWQLRYINRRTIWDHKDVKFQILQCVFHFYSFHWHPIIIWSSLRPNSGRLIQKSNLLTTRIYEHSDDVRSQRCQIKYFAMCYSTLRPNSGILSQKSNILTTIIYEEADYVRSQRCKIPNFEIVVFIFIRFIDKQSKFLVLWEQILVG